jgi:hypothetical protein
MLLLGIATLECAIVMPHYLNASHPTINLLFIIIIIIIIVIMIEYDGENGINERGVFVSKCEYVLHVHTQL